MRWVGQASLIPNSDEKWSLRGQLTCQGPGGWEVAEVLETNANFQKKFPKDFRAENI